jgi:hypothetical protein
MTYSTYVNPMVSGRTGTLNPSQFNRTGSAYTNPDFLKLYMAQLENQSYDTLFGEEGLNNSIFGSSSMFSPSTSSTSSLFGGLDQTSLPSDISGLAGPNSGGSQYINLIMQSYLVGKIVDIRDPQTGQVITGKVNSVINDPSGAILLDVDGKKIPPENLIKISQAQ